MSEQHGKTAQASKESGTKTGERHGLQSGEVIAGGHLGGDNEGHSVLGEGLGGTSGVVRFKIDGVEKSLSKPVIGMELYRVAGSPKSVSVGGKKIENNNEPVEIEDGAEVTITR